VKGDLRRSNPFLGNAEPSVFLMPELAGDEVKSKLARPVQPRLLHERPFLVERASSAKLDDVSSSGWQRPDV